MRRPDATARVLSAVACATLLAACATSPRPTHGLGGNPIALRSINAAQELLERGALEQALEQARIARDADPRSVRAHVAEGQVLEAMGRTEAAGESLAKALALGPADGVALNARGTWLCRQGATREGLALLGKAIEDPAYRNPVQALSNAGNCALRADLLPTAELNFRAALGLAPNDARSLVGMAHAKLKQGDALGARAFLQRREALGPLAASELELAIRIDEGAGDARAAGRYRAQLATAVSEGAAPNSKTPGESNP